MSNKDSLSTRMKEFYENRAKTYLVRRIPVVLRIDGKNFSRFTKGLNKPYDKIFRDSMSETMKYLCENIQGCKVGYTQSDEISLLLTDDDTLTTDAWFDYSEQKLCSISASMATRVFNKTFAEKTAAYEKRELGNYASWRSAPTEEKKEIFEYINTLYSKAWLAEFDARCFNIAKEDVVNYFIFRQQDATRNAIQMLGQCNFPHNELQGKTTDQVQEMLKTEKNINFNDMPTEFKRGSCCIKGGSELRKKWMIDKEIPIFTKDREYIESCFQKAEEDDD